MTTKTQKRWSEEQQERCLDFAKRMCFHGYPSLTDKRKARLWADAQDFLESCFQEAKHEGCHFEGWDVGEGFLPCDYFPEMFDHRYGPPDWKFNLGIQNRFECMLSAITRSAIDIISEYGGGVWGFTVGDIKRMYEGEVPDWMAVGWKRWCEKNGKEYRLDALPDDMTLAI